MNEVHSMKKRVFDVAIAVIGLSLGLPVILMGLIAARISTGDTGVFRQERVGRDAKLFTLYKIRTMRKDVNNQSTVTTDNDDRITSVGRVLRKCKIDELPQLWNVLLGDMSVVGPRPDVKEMMDNLQGSAREVLRLKPGITGPATIKYRHEESLLAQAEDSEEYNRSVIFPDKTDINLKYAKEWSLLNDFKYVLITVKLYPCPDDLQPPEYVAL